MLAGVTHTSRTLLYHTTTPLPSPLAPLKIHRATVASAVPYLELAGLLVRLGRHQQVSEP